MGTGQKFTIILVIVLIGFLLFVLPATQEKAEKDKFDEARSRCLKECYYNKTLCSRAYSVNKIETNADACAYSNLVVDGYTRT